MTKKAGSSFYEEWSGIIKKQGKARAEKQAVKSGLSSYYSFEESYLLPLYQDFVVPVYDELKELYNDQKEGHNISWANDIQMGYDVDYTIDFSSLSIPLIIDFWRWCCEKKLIR
jgi:hypothetical protein